MSLAPHFQLVSEVLSVQRRDFYLEDPTLLNPINANPILDGEWLILNSNYKLVRGADEQAGLAWQVFAERGRYDTQAIGKTVILFLGGYEAESSIYNPSGIAAGDGLAVGDVTIGGVAGKRGLIKAAGTGVHRVFGFVTRVMTGKVRYVVPCAGGSQVTI